MRFNEVLFLNDLKDNIDSYDFKRLSLDEKQKITKKTLRKFKTELRKSIEELRKTQKGSKIGYFSMAKFSRRFGIKIDDIRKRLSDFDHISDNGFIYINKIQKEQLILSFNKTHEVKAVMEKTFFETVKQRLY